MGHERAKGDIHAVTIKNSKRRGTWQLKATDHRVISLHWFHPIIRAVLRGIGIDFDDRTVIIELRLSDEPFEGSIAVLEKRPESESPLSGCTPALYGVYYRMVDSVWGQLDVAGFAPRELIAFFGGPPQHLHLAMEPTTRRRLID